MTSLPRLIIALGILDLAYVAWATLDLLSGAGVAGYWQSIVAFGLPYPALQASAVVGVYIAIFICGLGLLLRRPSIALLNYALFPVRVLLALPTIFPLFAVLDGIGFALHPGTAFVLLVLTELARIILVRTWAGSTSAADRPVGAAA